MSDAVVGRVAELAEVEHLLDGVGAGASVLVLSGEAGIGKTTVWRAGVDAASGRSMAVLWCRPAPTEVRLSYAGFTDLLASVPPDAFDALPAPQRRALDAALLRGPIEGTSPDPRAVAATFLSILSGLARSRPVLVAIDDVQWLDEPTRGVVQFAIRRCSGPMATLLARRHSAGDDADATASGRDRLDIRPPDGQRFRELHLSPLSLGALHHVVKQQLGRSFPRRTMARIAEASGGNPFFAIELAHSVDAGAANPAALPTTLRDVVQHRLDGLDPAICDVLLMVGAHGALNVELLRRAASRPDIRATLEQAEDAGILDLSGGTVRFSHPLLASAVYGEAARSERRAVHRRLSRVVDEPEQRARHLALGAIGVETDTVVALQAAAEHARRRGAPANAAELLELAIDLGADEPTLQLQAAADLFRAGDPARARRLLEQASAAIHPAQVPAEALRLLAMIRFEADGAEHAVDLLLQARERAADDPSRQSSIGMELCYVLAFSGRLDEARRCALDAAEQAEPLHDSGLLAEALAIVVTVGFLSGEGLDEKMLARALALEDPDRQTRVNLWPTFLAGLVYRLSHRLDEARTALDRALHRCTQQGAESEGWLVLFQAVAAALAAGDVGTAERYVGDLVDQTSMVGTDQSCGFALTSQAELWAWTGRVDDALAAGNEALTLLTGGGVATFALLATSALGMAELSVGDHHRAADHLAPAAQTMTALGFREPAAMPLLPDAVEALVALTRLTEAEPIVELLETSGRRRDRPWAAAVGARCRGLLLAAQGDPEEAGTTLQKALDAHDRLPQMRYDRARTLLVLGQLQRRRNQRRAARTSLDEAAQLFEAVGANRWGANARAELDRLGLKPGPDGELTPTEAHVAHLAASGYTVREAAATLFISPKTVEAHLTRIYRKLGIHTRAELGRLMAERERPSS